jgi:phosphate transport system protein
MMSDAKVSKHLRRDLDRIERGILEVGALVEQQIHNATTALIAGRWELAQQVVEADEEIDRREVELEEICLKVLALHAPVAVDLRFIVAVIKVNSTLERMGDLACNIARSTQGMTGSEWRKCIRVERFAELVRGMVRQCLDALVRLDPDQARAVIESDDAVDQEKDYSVSAIIEMCATQPQHSADAIRALLVSRYLERIADQATNIAEDIVFMVSGDIVRHSGVHLK